MNIIYFGYNALSSCLDLLLHTDQHQVLCVYTGEQGTHTQQIIQLCEDYEVEYFTHKPTEAELKQWVTIENTCFICAEYPYKLDIPTQLKFGINIHPTLLPEGRGQTPLPHIIMSYPESAGITLHTLSSELDSGDILIQKQISLDNQETFDSLLTKVFLEAPILLQKVIDDIHHYFEQATPQVEGSYWQTIGEDQQVLDWNKPIKELDKVCRAFGSLGVKFTLNQSDYYTTTAQAIKYQHAYSVGDVVSFDDMKLIVASIDGFIIIPRECLYEL